MGEFNMLISELVFAFLLHAVLAGSTVPIAPENITVTFINPSSVRVSWQQTIDIDFPIEKYDITYKPASSSYAAFVVAGTSEAVTLRGLLPDTQYVLTVAAIWSGRKYRSRPIVFRTLGEIEEHSLVPKSSPQQDNPFESKANSMFSTVDPLFKDSNNSANINQLPTVRGVEIGIVVLVLFVWAGAIGLFFNRWGKIRMLLPYQPDYKQDQLKVPGTGVCTNSGVCNGHSHHQHMNNTLTTEEPSIVISERCQRARINSAIFVSSEGRGFDSIEFISRYGSQSVLCRKAKSAENITSGNQNRRFSENPSNKIWESEETKSSPQQEKIEIVDVHTFEENSIPTHKSVSSTNKTTKKLLSGLPTLSISGPSRNQSPTSPTEEDEAGNFL